MDLLSALWIGIVCALTSAAPVGPVNFVVIQSTLLHGRWAGMLVALGGVSSDIVYASIAWCLSDLIIGEENPALFMWMNFVSIPVVIYLGLKMVRSRNIDPAQQTYNPRNLFFQGFLLGISNPGLLFYWFGAVAFAQAGGYLSDSTAEFGMFVLGAAIGIMAALMVVILASSLLARKVSTKIVALLNLLIGLGFIGFGVVLTIRAIYLYIL